MTKPSTSNSSTVADQSRWFADEVHPHDAQLKSYLRRSFPDVRDLDDVVQESYLRVWKRHLVQPIVSAKSFLFQVARRLALNTVRHDRASPINVRVTETDASGVSVDKDLRDTLCTRQDVLLLLDAINTLPSRCREIVLLRKIEGLSQKNIAEQLGLSEQTVQVQACRGLKRLQKVLRERGQLYEDAPPGPVAR